MAARREIAMTHVPRPAPDGGAAMIHPTALVDEPSEIGAGTWIWHFSHVRAGSRIGRDCTIGRNVTVGPNVAVGDHCNIQNNVSVYEGVTLEDGVFCGPSCVFTNVKHPRAEVERKAEFRPTHVARGATIGANATVVCGTRLGAYCFVAAGAVVTKDVPAHALVAGVPARRIGWVSHAGEPLGPDLVCRRDGRRYRQVAPDRLEELAPGTG
jgi:UDP-2-acetamido-3-amino-2,3-dideoxy-glucuronate N-acetyltransferase